MAKDIKSLFENIEGIDPKSLNFLIQALAKNNLQGFDYIEFKQSLGNLRSMNLDEATAFKSVFATASSVGLTKEKLIQSASHYKSVLEKEKQQFDNALQKQMQQRVQSKMGEVKQLNNMVQEFQLKIQELEEKISKAQRNIAAATAEIEEAKSKIQSTNDNFAFTFKTIIDQMNNDIENINQYL